MTCGLLQRSKNSETGLRPLEPLMRSGRHNPVMANLIGEMLLGLIRILIEDWFKQAAIKVCAWLDTKVRGRIVRFVLGGFLGLTGYLILPIILGLFH